MCGYGASSESISSVEIHADVCVLKCVVNMACHEDAALNERVKQHVSGTSLTKTGSTLVISTVKANKLQVVTGFYRELTNNRYQAPIRLHDNVSCQIPPVTPQKF